MTAISPTSLFQAIQGQITGQTASTDSASQSHEAAASSFGGIIKSALQEVQDSQKTADALHEQMQSGSGDVAIHDVMISMQKASLNFQMAVQTRNKVVQAYQQISQIGI